MSDFRLYEEKLRKSADDFESICRRCGVCCGSSDGDPCENLEKETNDRYRCKIYNNRLGPQKTIGGKIFNCVPIRELIRNGGMREGCAYST